MTREEAIAIFKGFKFLPREMKAVEMAIKALEQEPCEDAVSRQAVITEIKDWWERGVISIDDIRKLPPVTPARKHGKWIKDKGDHMYHCTRCYTRWVHVDDMNYCPRCGADMRG